MGEPACDSSVALASRAGPHAGAERTGLVSDGFARELHCPPVPLDKDRSVQVRTSEIWGQVSDSGPSGGESGPWLLGAAMVAVPSSFLPSDRNKRVRNRVFHLVFLPLNGCNSWGRVRPRPGARHATQASHVRGANPRTLPFSAACPGGVIS